MEVTLAAGAIVDIATRGDVEAHNERLDRLLDRSSADFEIKAAGVPAAGAALGFCLVIDFGGPPAGMMWKVQWVAAFGNDPMNGGTSTVITNVVGAFFVGRPPSPLPDNPPSVRLCDHSRVVLPAFTLPQTVPVPDSAFVRSADHAYILLAGTGLVAGGANYRATLGVLKSRDNPGLIASL